MQPKEIVMVPRELEKGLLHHIRRDQQCVTEETDLESLNFERRRLVVVGPPDFLARLSGVLLMRYIGGKEKFTYVLPPRFQGCIAQVKRFLEAVQLRPHCRLVVPKQGFLYTIFNDGHAPRAGTPNQ